MASGQQQQQGHAQGGGGNPFAASPFAQQQQQQNQQPAAAFQVQQQPPMQQQQQQPPPQVQTAQQQPQQAPGGGGAIVPSAVPQHTQWAVQQPAMVQSQPQPAAMGVAPQQGQQQGMGQYQQHQPPAAPVAPPYSMGLPQQGQQQGVMQQQQQQQQQPAPPAPSMGVTAAQSFHQQQNQPGQYSSAMVPSAAPGPGMAVVPPQQHQIVPQPQHQPQQVAPNAYDPFGAAPAPAPIVGAGALVPAAASADPFGVFGTAQPVAAAVQPQPAPAAAAGQLVPQQQQQQLVPQQQQQWTAAAAPAPQPAVVEADDDFFGVFSAKKEAEPEPTKPAAVAAAPDGHHGELPPISEIVTAGGGHDDGDAVSVVSRGTPGRSGYGSGYQQQQQHPGPPDVTSRGKQLFRDDVDPEDTDRALAAANVPPATSTALTVSNGAPTYAPPPPNSPSTHYGRVIAQTTQLPNASPLPNRDVVLHSGHILSRISFRTILFKKWKQTFWVQYGLNSILFFRNTADYEDWVNNPYLNNTQRDFLVKLQVDFVSDLTKVNVRGYQVTHARMKAYKARMLHQFKLERWMDYGPTIAAAFASQDVKEVRDLRRCIIEIMRNCPQDPMLVHQSRASPNRYNDVAGQYQYTQNANSNAVQPRHQHGSEDYAANGGGEQYNRSSGAASVGGQGSERRRYEDMRRTESDIVPSGAASTGGLNEASDNVSVLSGVVSEAGVGGSSWQDKPLHSGGSVGGYGASQGNAYQPNPYHQRQ